MSLLQWFRRHWHFDEKARARAERIKILEIVVKNEQADTLFAETAMRAELERAKEH